MKTENAIQHLLAQDEVIAALLSEIGSDNVHNALRKLKKEREIANETRRNFDELISAHGTDNWKNAVRIAKSRNKNADTFPEWASVVPPAWLEKVRPALYQHWLRVCGAHIRVIEKFLRDVHGVESLRYTEEMERVRREFIRCSPEFFIDLCSEFYHDNSEEETYITEETAMMSEAP
jgi:hypothetical protein